MVRCLSSILPCILLGSKLHAPGWYAGECDATYRFEREGAHAQDYSHQPFV